MATPFEILSDIARKSHSLAAGLPEQEEAVELWNGIGFQLVDHYYLAKMGSISELLPLPRYTPVPGVKPWMRGVANVRGRLIPIIDLALFFGLRQSSQKIREKRVLVVEQGDMLAGLVVDRVLGMQYFPRDSFEENTADADVSDSIRPYLDGSCLKSDLRWHFFDTKALTMTENFFDVAARA